jgi:hypothetical protein
MSDNKENRGPTDRSRVNVHEDYQLNYWSEKFGVSHDRLKKVVGKVGVMVVDVEKELRK